MRGGYGERLRQFKLGRLGVGGDAAGQIKLARFRRRHRLERRAAGFLERLVDGNGIGIENDGHNL